MEGPFSGMIIAKVELQDRASSSSISNGSTRPSTRHMFNVRNYERSILQFDSYVVRRSDDTLSREPWVVNVQCVKLSHVIRNLLGICVLRIPSN
jgi:hypothetical protein